MARIYWSTHRQRKMTAEEARDAYAMLAIGLAFCVVGGAAAVLADASGKPGILGFISGFGLMSALPWTPLGMGEWMFSVGGLSYLTGIGLLLHALDGIVRDRFTTPGSTVLVQHDTRPSASVVSAAQTQSGFSFYIGGIFFLAVVAHLATYGYAIVSRVSGSEDPDQTLITAARQGNVAEVGKALGRGADEDASMDGGSTALMIAASRGDLDVMRALLETGADVDATQVTGGAMPSNTGSTALMFAAGNGHTEALRLLLRSGANPHAENNSGRTALTMARRWEEQRTGILLSNASPVQVIEDALATSLIPPTPDVQQQGGVARGESASSASSPRFDGLYRTVRKTGATFLRFDRDGTVYMRDEDATQKHAKDIVVAQRALGLSAKSDLLTLHKGSYTVRENGVTFSIVGYVDRKPFVHRSFDATFDGGSLLVKKSRDTTSRSPQVFEFVQVLPLSQ